MNHFGPNHLKAQDRDNWKKFVRLKFASIQADLSS